MAVTNPLISYGRGWENIFLNWQYSALTREVKNGNRVAFFPPVAGG